MHSLAQHTLLSFHCGLTRVEIHPPPFPCMLQVRETVLGGGDMQEFLVWVLFSLLHIWEGRKGMLCVKEDKTMAFCLSK